MTNTNTAALNETQTAWLNALGFTVLEMNGSNFTARAYVGGASGAESEAWFQSSRGGLSIRDRVVFTRDGANFTARAFVGSSGRRYAGGYSGPDARTAARTARELLTTLTVGCPQPFKAAAE